ncbi:MAG: flagellar basal body protein, partial [Paraglaciecola sp.]|nr:flagellar basal body protein [Paraglaciecola sp.]
MSLFNVMDIATSGMSAQSVRLNTTASNVANANSVSSSYESTYKARHPVFAAELKRATDDLSTGSKVQVLGVVESQKPLQIEYS